MKTLIPLLLFCITSMVFAQAPELEWVSKFNSTNSSSPDDIAITENGDLIILCTFFGSMDVDPSQSQQIFYSNGQSDLAIIKLSKYGNLIWAKQFGSPGNDAGVKINTNQFGDVYVSGRFQDSLDTDPGVSEAMLYSNGAQDGILIILNEDGDFVNSKNIGGYGYDVVFDIEFDSNNQCWVSGMYTDSINFNPSTSSTVYFASGGIGSFIAKVDSSLNFEPVLLTAAENSNGIYDFAFNEQTGNFHYLNYFSDTLNSTFSNTSFALPSRGSMDVVYGIIDSNGSNLGYSHLGGVNYDIAYLLTKTNDNNFLTFLSYEDSLMFTSNGQSTYLEANMGAGSGVNYFRNTAVVKFDSLDVEWFNTINAVDGDPNVRCTSNSQLQVDSYDNIYMALAVDGESTVDQPNLNNIQGDNIAGLVLSKQNSTGYFTGLYAYSGTSTIGGIWTRVIEMVGDTLYIGFHSGSVIDFDLTETEWLADISGSGVAKYIVQQNFLEQDGLTSINSRLFPNPVNDLLYLKVNSLVKLQILDFMGREVYADHHFNGDANEFNTSQLQNGVYVLSYMHENSRFTERFVVQH